jgi:hypothetical protein
MGVGFILEVFCEGDCTGEIASSCDYCYIPTVSKMKKIIIMIIIPRLLGVLNLDYIVLGTAGFLLSCLLSSLSGRLDLSSYSSLYQTSWEKKLQAVLIKGVRSPEENGFKSHL